MNKIFIFIAIFFTPLFSYLDPGTGSMLLSSVVALIATALYSAKSFFYNIVSFTNKIFNKQTQRSKFNIVLYNEGNQYFSIFSPVLKEMIKRDMKFIYLYSNEDDLIIKSIEGINSHFIGVGNKAFLYLNTLEADMCIMTTPGLDILQIKRSAGVRHYMHLHHSVSGTAGYKVFSTDCFDSVLVPNELDKKLIEGIEIERNIEKKKIEIVGTPYLDYYSQQMKNMSIKKDNNTSINILISPTWGKHGLLSKIGVKLLDSLLQYESFNLIIRPHPQSVLYEKEMIKDLQNRFNKHKNIKWDYENNFLPSMSKADIMISDFSGIILDFIFLFDKQVITMPSEFDYDGKDYISKDINLWHTDFFLKYTKTINENDIANLKNLITKLLKLKNTNNLINDINPFFTKSATKTVDVIEQISKELGL
jgi:CDP-glycerol glycerophosphotransferase (TagB/SpsB family)